MRSKNILHALFGLGFLTVFSHAAQADDTAAWLDQLEQEVAEKEAEEIQDPLEGINKAIYFFNRTFDGLILKPLAILWRDAVNDHIKEGVSNAISNIFLPVQTINLVLQGEGAKAFESIFRLVTNSTIGVLGVFDPATEFGLKDPKTNMNETLAKWGVERGPYIMLPFFGPSSMRSAVGIGADWFMNPWRFYVNNTHRQGNHHGQEKNIYMAIYAVDLVERRADLIGVVDQIDATSPDTYAAIRNYFDQNERHMEEKIKARHVNNAADRA